MCTKPFHDPLRLELRKTLAVLEGDARPALRDLATLAGKMASGGAVPEAIDAATDRLVELHGGGAGEDVLLEAICGVAAEHEKVLGGITTSFVFKG
jgi:hypothetical protein